MHLELPLECYLQLMANAVISCFVHTCDTTQALSFKKYGTSSDVWSHGMLMNEIWSLGEKPFPSLSPLEVSCVCVHAAIHNTAAYFGAGSAVSVCACPHPPLPPVLVSCIQCVAMLQNNPHYVQPPPPGCPRAIYQQMVLCW